MSNGKGGQIGKTALSFLENVFREQLYNKQKRFSNKYTSKGIECEQESVILLSKYYGRHLLKNDIRYENEFCTGEPDIYHPLPYDLGIDIKNSWSFETFPLWDDDLFKLNPIYWWQAQAYMWLLDIDKYKVTFTLNDAPEWIVNSEAWSLLKESGLSNMTDEFREETRSSMSYSNTPLELRIKEFNVDRNEKSIIEIQNRVIEARKILKGFEDAYKNLGKKEPIESKDMTEDEIKTALKGVNP